MIRGGNIGARVAIVAEGGYHIGDVSGWHEISRWAAAILLLVMLAHAAEQAAEAWVKRHRHH